jgi:hypothetical protein
MRGPVWIRTVALGLSPSRKLRGWRCRAHVIARPADQTGNGVMRRSVDAASAAAGSAGRHGPARHERGGRRPKRACAGKDRPRNVLSSQAAVQAAALDGYFERARAIVLLSARNPAFARFYAAPGARRAKILAGGDKIAQVNSALAYLQQLYPDRIGEACFIDRGGAENARVVRGRRARPGELSPDESANPFFAPTFALAVSQVYQARPYVSPDTGEWWCQTRRRFRAHLAEGWDSPF